MEDPSAAAGPTWRLKLKVHSGPDIRLVAVDRDVSFSKLVARIASDFSFEADPVLKYQDADGDLILLTCQNDLNELVASSKEAAQSTVVVFVQPAAAASRVAATLAAPTPSTSAIQLVPLAPPLLRGGSSSPLSEVYPPPATTRQAGGGAATSAESPHPPPHAREGLKRHSVAAHAARGASSLTTEAAGIAFRWRRGDQILGQGAFGTVYVGLNKDTGELLAVKQLDTCDVSVKELAALEHEIAMLKGLHHMNIVRYYGTEQSAGTLSILLEYVPGGSIRTMLDRFGPLGEPIVRAYSRQLLLGLEYLHRAGIAHRDIKGGNVLITQDGCVKLADFGASKRLNNATGSLAPSGTGTGTGLEGLKGTPLWMAPEVIREQHLHRGWKKADIWSVGCTVIEMATGRPPWSEFDNPVTAMYHIACTDEIPPMPSQLSGIAHDFLKLCFRRDPLLRPNVTKLLLHPFVATTTTPLLHAQAAAASRPAAFGGTVAGTSAASGLYLPPRPATGVGGREHHRLLVPPEHPTYHPIEEDPEGRRRSTAARRAGRSGADNARGGGGRGLGHLGVEVLVPVGGGHAAASSPFPASDTPQPQQSVPDPMDAAVAAAQLAVAAPSLVASSAWQLGGNVLDTLQASPRALTADSAGGGARPSTSGSAFVKVRPTAAGSSGLGSPGRASQASSSPPFSPMGDAGERLVPAQIPHSASIASELGDKSLHHDAQWGVDAATFPVEETAATGDEMEPPFPATPTFTSPEPAPPFVPEQPNATLAEVFAEPSREATSPVVSASAPPSQGDFSPAGSPDDFDEAAAFAKSAELSTDALQVENAAILDHMTSAALSLSGTGRLHQHQQAHLSPPFEPPADVGALPGIVSPALSGVEQDARSQSSAAGTGGTRSGVRVAAAADTGALPSLPAVHSFSRGARGPVGAGASAATAAPSPFVIPPLATLTDAAPTALPLGALRVTRLAATSRADLAGEDGRASTVDATASASIDLAPLSSARRHTSRVVAAEPALPIVTPDASGVHRAGLQRREESSPLSMASSATPSLAHRATSPLSSVGVSEAVPRDTLMRAVRSSAPSSVVADDEEVSTRAEATRGTGDLSARRVGSSRRQYARYSDLDSQPVDSHATSPTAGSGAVERAPARSESGYAARHGSSAAHVGGQRIGGLQNRDLPSSSPTSPTHRRGPSTQTAPASTGSNSVGGGPASNSRADASASASPGAGYASDASTSTALLQSQAVAAVANVPIQDGGRPRLTEVPEHYARYEGAAVASPVKRASASVVSTAGARIESAAMASADDSLQARFPSRIPRISTNYGRAKSTASGPVSGGAGGGGAVVADAPVAAPAPLLPATDSTSASYRPVVRSDSFNRGQLQRNRGQYARPSPDVTPGKGTPIAPDAAAAGSAARPGSRGMHPPTPPTALQSLLASGDFPYEQPEGTWTVQEHTAAAPADPLPASVASTLSLVRAKSGGYNRSKGRGNAAVNSASAGQGLHPPRSAAPRRAPREGGVHDTEDAGGADDTPEMSVAWTAATASLHHPQPHAQSYDRARASVVASARPQQPYQPQQPSVRGTANRARSRTDESTWGPELPSVEPERLQLQPPFQSLVDAPFAATQSRAGGQFLRLSSAAAWDSSPITWPPTQPTQEPPTSSLTVPVGTLVSAGIAPPFSLTPESSAVVKAAGTSVQNSARRGGGGAAVIVGTPASAAPRSSTVIPVGSLSGNPAPAPRGGAAALRTTAGVVTESGLAIAASAALPSAGLPVFRSARESTGSAIPQGASSGFGLVAVGQSSHQYSRQAAAAVAAPGSVSGGGGWSAHAPPQPTNISASSGGGGGGHSHSYMPQPASDEASFVIRSSPVRILEQQRGLAAGGATSGIGYGSSRQQASSVPVASAIPGVVGGSAAGGTQGLVVSGGGLIPGSGGVASFRQVATGPSLSPIIPERPAAMGAGAAPAPWPRAASFASTPDADARALNVPSRTDRAGSGDDDQDGFYGGSGGGAGLGTSADGGGGGGSGDSESLEYGALPALTGAGGGRSASGAPGAHGGGGGGDGGLTVPFPFLVPGSVHQPFPAPGGSGSLPAEAPAEPSHAFQPQPPPPQHAGFRGVASPRLSLVTSGGGGGGAAASSSSSVAAAGQSASRAPQQQLQLQPAPGGGGSARLRGNASSASAGVSGLQPQQLAPPAWGEAAPAAAASAASGGGGGRRPAAAAPSATFLTYGGSSTTVPSPQSPGSADWDAH